MLENKGTEEESWRERASLLYHNDQGDLTLDLLIWSTLRTLVESRQAVDNLARVL